MKYLNFILTLLTLCIIVFSCIIYFKPVTGRYRFQMGEYKEFGGELAMGLQENVIQDTATGKIYEWTIGSTIVGKGKKTRPVQTHSLEIKDPANNRIIWKSPSGQKEHFDFLLGKMDDDQKAIYRKRMLR